MRASLKKTIELWENILPYINIPSNEKEYAFLLKVVEELMETSRFRQDERAIKLLKLIARNIETYEQKHYPSKAVSSAEVLAFLMEEHGLGQNDLPEIGGQSLISKILNGKRQLTVSHIKFLSEKFHVSPLVFLDGE